MKLSTRSPQPPGDLDDEAEVEVAAVLERLDTAEEWRVLWERLRSAVEHGGLDLDPLRPSPSPARERRRTHCSPGWSFTAKELSSLAATRRGGSRAGRVFCEREPRFVRGEGQEEREEITVSRPRRQQKQSVEKTESIQ